MSRFTLLLGAAALLLALGILRAPGSPAAPSRPPGPSGFAARVDNPWFPLHPDTTYIYRGIKDGQPSRDVFTVTAATKTIQVDGARAGIFMPAHPHLGQSGRQEYYKGHAEDRFRVLSLAADVHTPAASSSHALLTREWTPLEPGVVDHKLYVKGIGTVLEQAVKGDDERNSLVAVARRSG